MSKFYNVKRQKIFYFKKIFFLISAMLIITMLTGCSYSKKTNEYGQNELMRAIYYKDYSTAKRLVSKNPKIIAEKDRNGENAIHYAAKYGTGEIMEYLLSEGGDKLLDVEEYIQTLTPIQVATISGNVEAFHTLMAHPDGKTQLFSLDSRKRTLLHLAASAVSTNILKELLTHGIDPNIQDGEGNTPLMLLFYSVDQYESKITEGTVFRMTKLFLENGTNIYMVNNKGDSVLSILENASLSGGGYKYIPSKHTILDRASFQIKILIKSRY